MIKNDMNIFSDEEMEENDMNLFNKKDKYDIDEKDNKTQMVYGKTDNLRKQWENGVNRINKYNIKAEDNYPQELYDIPKSIDSDSEKCPYCGSVELWKYLYGEPTYDYDKDKYVLGGCEITGKKPIYKCKKCGKDIYRDSEFELPIIANKSNESIKINIKNDKNNYVLMLNHFYNPEVYNLTFLDLNNLDGKYISDASMNLSKKYYDQFVSKLYSIISNWQDNYQGESNVEWNIKFDMKDNTRVISGNGGFPSNWNEFIDLMSEYEKIFKTKDVILSTDDNSNEDL